MWNIPDEETYYRVCGRKHASYVYCFYNSLNLFTYLDSHLQHLKANHL